jgi:hypothetical protein
VINKRNKKEEKDERENFNRLLLFWCVNSAH